MSQSLNRCEFIGRVGKDPELKYTPSGSAVCSFSIACTESWKDKDSGEKQEATEWVRIVAWERLAEIIGEYVHQGDLLFIEGKFKTRKWEKDGKTQYITEIQANRMIMLGSPSKGEDNRGGGNKGSGTRGGGGKPASRSAPQPRQRQQTGTGFDDMDDDIPF